MARIVLVILIAAALWLGPGREAGTGETRMVPAHGWWIAAELAFERGDRGRALELFREQAHYYYGAIARLGELHEGGRCIGEELPPAAELYERLIAEDLGIAGARLGYLHLHGLGVVRDEARARRLFKGAVLWLAVNESPERRRAVVAQVMSGHGVPAELATELAWLERLEAGPARKLYEVALKLKEGRGGLPRHEAAARRLVHRAAMKGLPEAFCTRGMWDLAAARDPDDRRWALKDIARLRKVTRRRWWRWDCAWPRGARSSGTTSRRTGCC